MSALLPLAFPLGELYHKIPKIKTVAIYRIRPGTDIVFLDCFVYNKKDIGVWIETLAES